MDLATDCVESVMSNSPSLEVVGECLRCGRCCELAYKFEWRVHKDDDRDVIPVHPQNKVKKHDCRWEEDLEVVHCLGTHPRWPRYQVTSG